jgi:protein-S-isoprenylcysteine O-methyltransferase Ste14
MLEWMAFIAGTVFLAYASRASLRVPRSHGFYRFIAWEWMLFLVVYNLDGWYDAPLTADQAISGILMGISLLLFITSYLTLRQFGQPDDKRHDATLLVFEKTTALVNHGLYRYIRHPMYSSLIFLDWGLFFKQMSWLSGFAALVAAFFLVSASLVEEQENIRYFGAKYREYMKSSRRYLPFLL